MDIFKYAEEFDADYYDPEKCVIYRVQKYNRIRRLGLPVKGIEIVDLDGRHIGYIPKPK